MSKAILVMDMPESCLECHFKYKSVEMPLGNYTYKSLFRCKYEPDDISEDNGDIVYLNEIMMESKPSWCTLHEVPKKKDVDSTHYDTDHKYALGFNDCIDEILKGSE